MRLIRARRSRESVVGFGMKRIVKEHYPVERLPEELWAGFPRGSFVRATILVDHKQEVEAPLQDLAQKRVKADADTAKER